MLVSLGYTNKTLFLNSSYFRGRIHALCLNSGINLIYDKTIQFALNSWLANKVKHNRLTQDLMDLVEKHDTQVPAASMRVFGLR